MELNDYQEQAQATNLIAREPVETRRLAAMLGLASETGSILDIAKKIETASVSESVGSKIFRQELGDLLWYVAAVARAYDIPLEDLARENLARTRDGYEEDVSVLTVLDARALPTQQFPRLIEVKFEEDRNAKGRSTSKMTLLTAEPNRFPSGRTEREGKSSIGFTVGGAIGDALSDNARRVDGYRFHDAIHLGFLAVLGWSPVMRSVLGLKRHDDDDADEGEDSARPIFAEEGLAAILYRLSETRMGFGHSLNIDGEIIEVIRGSVVDTEVERIPGWAWRRAIKDGFRVMHELIENHGGIVTANLDTRELSFRTLPTPTFAVNPTVKSSGAAAGSLGIGSLSEEGPPARGAADA
jgi:NTP pyrophosphatase (non-canonical NTP hydrolase)